MDSDYKRTLYRKISFRLIPLLFLGYVMAFLDRVNIGFAKLQMAGDLGFSDAVYGLGAGLFFIGYCLFEVPSNVAMTRVGARRWMTRIMVSWGVISAMFVFVDDFHWAGAAQMVGLNDAQFSFYLLRFLLGVAEAGFYPGIILYLTYWFPRSRQAAVIALFMSAVGASNVLGGPLSGAILQFCDGWGNLRGWQWLFLLEGVPSVVVGFTFLFFLPDNPAGASWLSDAERGTIEADIAREEPSAHEGGHLTTLGAVLTNPRLWVLGLAYMAGTIALYAVTFWMPTLIQQFGINKTAYLEIGLLSMIPWGVMAVCQIGWARHSDRTGERRWHSFLGYLLASAGLVTLAAFSASEFVSMMALTMVTTGLGFSIVTFWPLAHRYFTSESAAAGIAMINSFGALGGYFGPLLIGVIGVGTASGGSAFLPLAAIAFSGGVVLLAATLPRRGPPLNMQSR